MSHSLMDKYGGDLWNLPAPTLGGKQLWMDEVCDGEWRLQKNVVTGHYRLLGPHDIRRAWGGFAGCSRALNEARAQGHVVSGPGEHLVVFLHGILRSKDSLSRLKNAFSNAGYKVAAINYPSTVFRVDDHAAQVDRVLRSTGGIDRVSVVTHSMGGLVVRRLLGQDPDPSDSADWRHRAQVHRVVMLFPPNQGAFKANSWQGKWWYQAVLGPAGQDLTTERAAALPIPPCPVAVIAGGRGDDRGRSWIIPGDDDGTVEVEGTRLRGADHRVIDVGHTFGMNDSVVIDTALDFVAGGLQVVTEELLGKQPVKCSPILQFQR